MIFGRAKQLEKEIAEWRSTMEKLAVDLGATVHAGLNPEELSEAIRSKAGSTAVDASILAEAIESCERGRDGEGGVMDPKNKADLIQEAYTGLAKEKAQRKAGGPSSEVREIGGGVQRVVCKGAVVLQISQGEAPVLEVSAKQSSQLGKLRTRIDGNKLIIEHDPITYRADDGAVVTTGPVIFGGGSISVGGTVRSYGGSPIGEIEDNPEYKVRLTLPEVRSISLSGASVVDFNNINQEEMALEISGAGVASLSGSLGQFAVEVSGAGKVKAMNLKSARATLRVSGAGNVSATATEEVRASVSGAGHIVIAGSPKERDTKASGAGEIDFV